MLNYRLRSGSRRAFPRPEGVDATLHALLISRGISSREEMARFLNPSADDLRDPMLLSDMDRAVAAIRRALRAGAPICVYGDYDADGVCASAILADHLRALGGEVRVYIPSRQSEGYGLNEAAVSDIARGSKLLVTVDCGVSNVKEIALAKKLGMDCVVTDHHRPEETLPDCPVVNPLLGGYPFGYLCGAGVALRVVEALSGRERALDYADIAALATVADVVPLRDENRILVKLGLDRINARPRPGLWALMESAGVQPGALTSADIAFRLAPRLNAAGRMGDANRAHALLLAETDARAHDLADALEQANSDRRIAEQVVRDEAAEQIAAFDFVHRRALVLVGKGWNPGVIGLSAGRLCERYYFPTILFSENNGVLTGSCRSIPGVDIFAALTAVRDHMIRYGGHSQAAGLSLKAEELEGFVRDLEKYLAENVPATRWIPEKEYDLDVSFDRLTPALMEGLEALEPTGCENPSPLFRAKAGVSQPRAIGREGQHLKVALANHGVQLNGLFWSEAHRIDTLPAEADILYTPRMNVYQSRISIDAHIQALKAADAPGELERKKRDEAEAQHDYLTDLLYNRGINADLCPPEITWEALADAMRAPRGTLILTGDLGSASALSMRFPDADTYVGRLPDDRRGFNAVCACPVGEIPAFYDRVVLAGVPCPASLTDPARAFALSGFDGWMDALPDLDALRDVYKGARDTLRSGERFYTREQALYLVAERARRPSLGCLAGLWVLDGMELVRWDPSREPPALSLCPPRKADPAENARWQALEKLRLRRIDKGGC